MNDFDAAAEAARMELPEDPKTLSVEELATWWKKHYRTAGHKRLGRMLIKLAA